MPQPNPNFVLYGNPLPNFNVANDRVFDTVRIRDEKTLHLPSATLASIDPNSPNGTGNNNPNDNKAGEKGNESLRNDVPQAGSLAYCVTPIEQNKTKDPCFDGRNHLYFSDGNNWIPVANCLAKNQYDPKAVDALGLTVLRGRRGAPFISIPPLPGALDNLTGFQASQGLGAPATQVIVPPSHKLPQSSLDGDTGFTNVIPWQGFDVNSLRPNGVAGNGFDKNRWPNITNPRPDEFFPRQSPKGYVEFKIPENGIFHVKFQGYFEYRANSDGSPDTEVSPDPNTWPPVPPKPLKTGDPDGDQLYLGLIFTDPDDNVNPFRTFPPFLPFWNEFFSAPRRIFRETVFTNPGLHQEGGSKKKYGNWPTLAQTGRPSGRPSGGDEAKSAPADEPAADAEPAAAAAVEETAVARGGYGYGCGCGCGDIDWPKHLGRTVQVDWVVDCANIRASPLAGAFPGPPWLWNLNPGRFKPGEKVRVWPVTSSNSKWADVFGKGGGRFPDGNWDNVKFQWVYGGKWYQSGRDYPDIKIEVDAVPDNFQDDASNPPPGANVVLSVGGAIANA